jgi:hypothetical protein
LISDIEGLAPIGAAQARGVPLGHIIGKGDEMAIKREKIQPQGIHVSMVDGKARLSLMIRKSSTDACVKLRAAGARPYRLDIGRGRLQPLVDANVASCIEFDAGGL